MTATAVAVMPTSGSARRMAKSQRNIEAGYDLESNWAHLNGRIPPSVVAASICPCGYRAWLMPGATDEEHEAFDRDVDDHGTYCEAA